MSQYIGTDVTLHEYTVLGIIIISQPDTKIIKEKKKQQRKTVTIEMFLPIHPCHF